MDTALKDGDFKTDKNGLPYSVAEQDELLQQALIRLQVPRGSFRYDRTLGSMLYALTELDDDTRALTLAQEALKPLPALTVERTVYQKKEPRGVSVWIKAPKGEFCLEVTL